MVTLVDVGLAAVAKMINGAETIAAFTYMATGSGTTDESTSQTALIAENTSNGASRGAATCTYETLGISKWVRTFTFTGSVTINELGIFNASSGGTMLMRHKLAATKSYSDGESVEITLTNTSSRV
jgi:hypothetical protein